MVISGRHLSSFVIVPAFCSPLLIEQSSEARNEVDFVGHRSSLRALRRV